MAGEPVIGPSNRRPPPPRGTEAEPPTVQEAAIKAMAEPGPALDKTGKGGVTKDHRFELNHTDQRGRLWTGAFQCHVLTYREKIRVGLTKAQLTNGVPGSSIDALTLHMLEMIAHLAVAVDSAPEWARFEELHDLGVVQAVYLEVAAHEARFHGTESIRDRTRDAAQP